MADVLLAFHRDDRPLAERLAGALTRRGVNLERRMHTKLTGRAADASFEACEAVLLVWSKQASNEPLLTQLTQAMGQTNLHIVLTDEMTPPSLLGRRYDLHDWRGEENSPALGALAQSLPQRRRGSRKHDAAPLVSVIVHNPVDTLALKERPQASDRRLAKDRPQATERPQAAERRSTERPQAADRRTDQSGELLTVRPTPSLAPPISEFETVAAAPKPTSKRSLGAALLGGGAAAVVAGGLVALPALRPASPPSEAQAPSTAMVATFPSGPEAANADEAVVESVASVSSDIDAGDDLRGRLEPPVSSPAGAPAGAARKQRSAAVTPTAPPPAALPALLAEQTAAPPLAPERLRDRILAAPAGSLFLLSPDTRSAVERGRGAAVRGTESARDGLAASGATARTLANGDVYAGEWTGAGANGAGVSRSRDGTEYAGYWKNSRWHGRGVMIFPNGVRYDGEFANGSPTGRGAYWDRRGRQLTPEEAAASISMQAP